MILKHKFLHTNLFILSLFLISAGQLYAQPKLFVQTSKNFYVSGEEVDYKCTLINPDSSELYILHSDICGEEKLITSQLLNASNNVWKGTMALPDTLQTGVYLLRCYIGDQIGKPIIATQLISVLNRFNNNSVNELRKKKTDYFPLDGRGYIKTEVQDLLQITPKQVRIKANNTLELSIRSEIDHIAGDLSLSVYKVDESVQHVNTNNLQPYSENDNIHIYNSLVLSGRLIDINAETPATKQTILLSSPDSLANLNYAYTDSLGEFKFHFNKLSGTQDIIIQTLNQQQEYAIELNPAFLPPPSIIPYYIPDDVENSEFCQLAIMRATVHQAFSKDSIVSSSILNNRYPFYGKTLNRIYPDKFIPLDDFAEISWEILPLVRYKYSKDSTYLRIWDTESNTVFNNPWALVDGIPVFDLASLNVLNSEKINWIEIQTQSRCYGDVAINGLISIQTKVGNFTELEMPKNAIRHKMQTFYQAKQKIEKAGTIFSDVLYWNPSINMANNSTNVSIKTSYEKGTYAAVAQTYDQQGKLYQTVSLIKVE